MEGIQSLDHTLVQPIELMGDIEWETHLLPIKPSVRSHATRPRLVQDTGLGFFEDESSSSGDDDNISVFNEVADSSGSNSDSDVTVLAPHDHDNETIDAGKSLPRLSGDENSWIQVLDRLADDHD